jgi:transposase
MISATSVQNGIILDSSDAGDELAVDLENTAYALDSTTIDLCLSMFPWARFRARKAAVKLHTLLDLRGSIPSFIHFTEGKVHDVNAMDHILFEPGAFYVMDRGYLDFARLRRITGALAFFVIRAKANLKFRRRYSHSTNGIPNILCDQTIVLTGADARRSYPEVMRRIRYFDIETQKELVFLTNSFDLPASSIAALYRCRWQIELFFKWIKQHLRIKAFYGTSENAVKTQVWIAISVYVLIAIIRKRLQLAPSLCTILQILSVNAFQKVPLCELLTTQLDTDLDILDSNQLVFSNL